MIKKELSNNNSFHAKWMRFRLAAKLAQSQLTWQTDGCQLNLSLIRCIAVVLFKKKLHVLEN